jgi:hypothetical protein
MSNLKDVHRLLDALEIEIERLTGRSFDLETSYRVAVDSGLESCHGA